MTHPWHKLALWWHNLKKFMAFYSNCQFLSNLCLLRILFNLCAECYLYSEKLTAQILIVHGIKRIYFYSSPIISLVILPIRLNLQSITVSAKFWTQICKSDVNDEVSTVTVLSRTPLSIHIQSSSQLVMRESHVCYWTLLYRLRLWLQTTLRNCNLRCKSTSFYIYGTTSVFPFADHW